MPHSYAFLVTRNEGGDGFYHLYHMPITCCSSFSLTGATADDSSPVWSPGGNRLAFVGRREQRLEIWSKPFTTGDEKLTDTFRRNDDSLEFGLDWSPDLRVLKGRHCHCLFARGLLL